MPASIVRTLFLAALFLTPVSVLRGEDAGEWQHLFNGRDLAGWKVVDGKEGSWTIEDGLMVCSGDGGGWISSEKEYANFEIVAEFRLPKGGNSGLFLRTPQTGNPAYVGLEIQLLDDDDEQYKELMPSQYTGSVYGVVAAERGHTKQPGDWQKIVVRCEGSHVLVTLNGKKIVDADLAQHDDKAAEHPGIKRAGGYVGLQNHGSQLAFRKVEIRELP
jgi:Domain of Unknown Function (DUF1080)